MKVLQISIEVNSGSVGRIAEQIGEKILENGGESYITFARNNLPSKSEVIRIGSKADVYYHVLNTRIFDNHCFESKKATKDLIAKIEKINPDIIHLHHLHGYFINIEILFDYLQKANKPVVWTFHDCWSFTGHCAHFEYVGCEKWRTQCYACPQKKEYPKSLLIDRSKKNYIQKKEIFNKLKNMHIVTPSQWLANLTKQSFLSNYPISVINNGIDIGKFNIKSNGKEIRNKFKIGEKSIILGVASTWDRKKGLHFFEELNEKINPDEVIVLVGLSSEQIKNLPKSIVGIQRTESIDDLASLYSAAFVFVNPTLEDTYPTTNLESIACGTPVITFRTGGSTESVNTKTGFVVEQNSLYETLNCFKIIKKNGKNFYQENCRNWAVNNFNKTDRFHDYISLYKKLLLY
ncbi:glycosyltransferase [Chryseobacterium taklimakanense]|uniref:glycosyltransferase n=1 Tax=Chryseobacterium taklimakanense TaxID=536441 RepID=UPI001EF471ED|nr:glycosyltransferase [Chryseobacterium taklimakanense]MCG7280439.1 glycosyltransferase [Chryseobacterium taklimakanense]